MSASDANPPPKPPVLSSIPSTPGPEVPGGYPRDSVVFSTNAWDQSGTKGKRGHGGLLAATKAYLPPAVASFLSSDSSPSPAGHDLLRRTNSAGHTPGVALHSDSSPGSNFSTRAFKDGSSSRGTITPRPDDFRTLGGRTFASRSNSNSVERDYFGPVAMDTATAAVEDEKEDPKLSPPVADPNPPSDLASSVDPTTLPVLTNPEPDPSPASPVSSNSTTSGSAFSTLSQNSTALSSVSSSPSVSSPKSLKPRPSVTYTPSTADARPTVSKTGSSVSPSSPRAHAGGGGGGNGGRLGMGAVRRFASLRRRDKPAPPPSAFGAHARGGSLDSQRGGGAASPVPEEGDVETAPASKSSRRASLLRTLRGVAGRVRGDKEKV